eukprot:Gregarina_sp_Poly_1__10130@NODE_691_length_6736_cov_671_948118_g521_i0_p1_GENE_NODE_691_length_6736_cov_671_948118_g521_i0NODE_691_length_6736_cov_671_948118_g521_i0_p1_ORF_typecomplete_len424_score20_28PAN_4/PF14295_6/7_1e05PAN_4/PF14295_6/1_8e04PAN_4/PF14295_6/1_8e04_NODE_691_length_6736_cov_671_948118_g521_i0611332
MESVRLAILLSFAAAQSAWDFQWPYGPNYTCACQSVPAIGEFYNTEQECLEAYADDRYQWCYHEGQGVTSSQCDDAVAIAEGATNDYCSSICTNLVAGTVTMEEFQATCKFNFYADFGDEVAVGWESCFSNLVYGWSDYDSSNSVQAAPLRVFTDVEGAVQCQALCQAVAGCSYWTWRAYPDATGSLDAFQNEPFTCLVYGQDYIEGVLNTVMPSSDVFALPTPYCNFPAITECMVDPFGRQVVDLFNPYSCLLCDCIAKCAWKSPYHLSGPAFCEREFRNECEYERPVWTSTLPPCESDPVTDTTIELEPTEETPDTGTTIELETTTEGSVDETTMPSTDTMGTQTPGIAPTGEIDQSTVTSGTSTTTVDSTQESSITATMGTATTTSLGYTCPECEDNCADVDDSILDCEDDDCNDECIDC